MEGSGSRGLINCSFLPGQASEEVVSYCWKLCQMCISIILLFFCFYEIYKQHVLFGGKFEWRFFTLLFMASSLITNIVFCLWNSLYVFYSFQSFFFSMYYLTITGYVFRLYMKKNLWDLQSNYNKAFASAMIIMTSLYTAILIDSIVSENSPETVNKSCELVWYLCINLLCLAMCFISLFILFMNYREEIDRIKTISYSDPKKVFNPFKELWCWIGFNTLAQLVNLIETGLLINTSHQNNCMIVSNSQIGNNILQFFFAIFTVAAGSAATLFYFAHIRKNTNYINDLESGKSFELTDDLRGSMNYQLFQNQGH